MNEHLSLRGFNPFRAYETKGGAGLRLDIPEVNDRVSLRAEAMRSFRCLGTDESVCVLLFTLELVLDLIAVRVVAGAFRRLCGALDLRVLRLGNRGTTRGVKKLIRSRNRGISSNSAK